MDAFESVQSPREELAKLMDPKAFASNTWAGSELQRMEHVRAAYGRADAFLRPVKGAAWYAGVEYATATLGKLGLNAASDALTAFASDDPNPHIHTAATTTPTVFEAGNRVRWNGPTANESWDPESTATVVLADPSQPDRVSVRWDGGATNYGESAADFSLAPAGAPAAPPRPSILGYGTQNRIDRITLFSDTIRGVVSQLPEEVASIPIDDLLEAAANLCNLVPAQLRYALLFADCEGYVKVDYTTGTVSRAS